MPLAGAVLEGGTMTGITPSDTQARAIAGIKDWYGSRSRSFSNRKTGWSGWWKAIGAA